MELAQKNRRHFSLIHLEPTEVLAVLRAARAKGSREWAMIVVAYKHGMRASEVCNLRLDDIDMKNGSIVVERLKGSLRTTQAVTEHRGEPLLNELKALREWLRQRRDDGSDFLFTSQKGGRLDRSQFFRLFRAIASKQAAWLCRSRILRYRLPWPRRKRAGVCLARGGLQGTVKHAAVREGASTLRPAAWRPAFCRSAPSRRSWLTQPGKGELLTQLLMIFRSEVSCRATLVSQQQLLYYD